MLLDHHKKAEVPIALYGIWMGRHGLEMAKALRDALANSLVCFLLSVAHKYSHSGHSRVIPFQFGVVVKSRRL